MRFNPKKTKSIVVGRYRTSALGCGDLTLDGGELEKVKTLCILRKLQTLPYLREVVYKTAKNMLFVGRERKLFDCARVLKSYFYAYVLPSLGIVPSCGCHFGLLDSIFSSAKKLCKGELYCVRVV